MAAIDLLADWLLSRDREREPVTADVLGEFLAEVPLGERSVRELRGHLGLAEPAPPARSEEEWDELIAACPVSSPSSGAARGGLWGRRDALVLALGAEGFTREDVVVLEPVVVDPERGVAAGIVLAWRENPASCHACALNRWLQVCARLPPHGGRYAARTMLATAGAATGHVCRRPVAGPWHAVYALLPAIDQHGWPGTTSISTRSVTRIWNMPRNAPQQPVAVSAGERRDRRVVFAELDELLAKLDERLARVEQITGQDVR